MNVAAGESATFLLTYQEILERVDRKYRHFIHVPSAAVPYPSIRPAWVLREKGA